MGMHRLMGQVHEEGLLVIFFKEADGLVGQRCHGLVSMEGGKTMEGMIKTKFAAHFLHLFGFLRSVAHADVPFPKVGGSIALALERLGQCAGAERNAPGKDGPFMPRPRISRGEPRQGPGDMHTGGMSSREQFSTCG